MKRDWVRHNMEFKNLSGKNKIIYQCIWGKQKVLPFEIEQNSDSRGATYKIAGNPGENGEVIQEAYNISNKMIFASKYKKAISGNGNEDFDIFNHQFL